MKKKYKKVKRVKKNNRVKKVKKTKSTKHIVEVRVSQTGMVPVNPITPKDLGPVKEGGKYMIPKTWVSERQVIRIVQKTPSQFILKRKGRGGLIFDYVPGQYFKKVLNYCFGWNWDFRIKHQEIIGKVGESWAQVITTGQLTVKDDKGHEITKEDTGKADIKYLKNTKTPMDIGNDYKAANTDCLKRCAVQLGIASDVYGTNEVKTEGYSVTENKPASAASSRLIIEAECHECAMPISKAEAEYSEKMYGKPLCRGDQKNAKRR